MDSIVEYNALRLAAHEYSMAPHALSQLCLPREHHIIKLCKMNFILFLQSRHVSSKISNRILRSDLGHLSLRSLAKLRDELEVCYVAVEIYGMLLEQITHFCKS